jgi:ABC-2 type transport system permease protein
MNYYKSWVAFWSIMRKELQRIFRIWPQTLLPTAITTTLYFLIFGKIIGGKIGAMSGGGSYIDFITPGLIILAIINNAYTNTVGSFFSAKFQRSIEELLVAPVHSSIILLGFTFGGIIRGLLNGCIVTCVAMFYTHLTIHHGGLLVLIAVLSSALFAIAGVANGIIARNFDDINFVPAFVLAPLTYLGGLFYELPTLQGIWYKISLLNPIAYIIDAFRYGFLGRSIFSVSMVVATLLLLNGLIFFLCYILLQRKVVMR